jgi:PilZ domain
MADEMDEIRMLIDKAGIRRRQRRRLNTPVCLIVERPDKVLLVNARFRDISDDGVAIFAGVELDIDNEVQLEFTPPFYRGPLRVRAIVRNRRKYVYGLEFLPRDGEEEQTLMTLKAMLLPTGTEAEGSLDDRRWT